METKIIKISNCKHKIEYKVKKEEFETALSSAFKNLENNNEAEGLTKDQYIEKNGMNKLCGIAVNAILKDSFPNIIKENNLSVLDNPKILLEYAALDKDPVIFHIEFEVYPEIELGQYFGLKIKMDSIEVSELEIEKEIQKTINNYATLIDSKDTILKKGHHAIIDFEGFLDDVPFEGGKATGYDLEIGSNTFVPGFEEQMIGMLVLEERYLHIKFPDDYAQSSLAGKETIFKVFLNNIKEKVYPKLTDDFISNTLKIDNVKTVKEYHDYIKETLTKNKKRDSYEKAKADYLSQVVNNANLEIPNCMIDKKINREIDYLEDTAKSYGVSIETLLSVYGFASIEDYVNNVVRNNSISEIKYNLVINEIIEKEKIEINDEEYQKRLEIFASSTNQTVEQVSSTYTKDELLSSFIYDKIEQMMFDSAIIE